MIQPGKNKTVFVTRSRLPHFEEYGERLKDIFASGWLTNDGQCVRQLEKVISEYLGCPHVIACNNGTTALMLALHCAGLRGKKVAVTPYTYVATLSALLWLNCEPVFVDIDPKTLCLSPEKLEEAFKSHPDIEGVLPVHIYGLACDHDAISGICHKHGAKLIYDGAQAFGSRYQGRSLLDYGDFSICSFHATKIFHTVEGGLVVAHSEESQKKLALARAFGHIGDTHYTIGINAKMSELHAAIGLLLLDGTKKEIENRKNFHNVYNNIINKKNIQKPKINNDIEWNYSYYPIIFKNKKVKEIIFNELNKNNIKTRRYFFPPLNTLEYVKEYYRKCKYAESISERVLCLPLYAEIKQNVIEKIAQIINTNASKKYA